MKKSLLAFIPARKGSKGLKLKNFKKINNKPIIEYTVESAIRSKIFTNIVISTDHKETINFYDTISNVEVHIRPKNLSQDKSLVIDAIKNYLKNNINDYKNIMILQPTSPLRNQKDIKDSYNLYIKNKADTLISVYKVDDHHPARMYKIINNKLIGLDKNNFSKRRQNLSKIYHRNGSIYIFKKSNLNKNTIYGKNITPFIMPIERSINIDNKNDFELAKILLR